VDSVGERVSVSDAARRLGLTPDGVRKRLAKGRLLGVREGGRQYVVVDRIDTAAGGAPRGDTASATPSDTIHDGSIALIAQLQGEVAWLRAQLEHRDTLLALALQRPALPPAVTVATAEAGAAELFPDSGNNSRPWWSRLAWWRR
jgi:hypothetical protein